MPMMVRAITVGLKEVAAMVMPGVSDDGVPGPGDNTDNSDQ